MTNSLLSILKSGMKVRLQKASVAAKSSQYFDYAVLYTQHQQNQLVHTPKCLKTHRHCSSRERWGELEMSGLT